TAGAVPTCFGQVPRCPRPSGSGWTWVHPIGGSSRNDTSSATSTALTIRVRNTTRLTTPLPLLGYATPALRKPRRQISSSIQNFRFHFPAKRQIYIPSPSKAILQPSEQ